MCGYLQGTDRRFCQQVLSILLGVAPQPGLQAAELTHCQQFAAIPVLLKFKFLNLSSGFSDFQSYSPSGTFVSPQSPVLSSFWLKTPSGGLAFLMGPRVGVCAYGPGEQGGRGTHLFSAACSSRADAAAVAGAC